MFKILLVILITYCTAPIHGQDSGAVKSEALTNANVIGMVNAGVPPDVIVTTIKGAGCAFQMDTDNLMALKQAHVPEAVVRAMASKECQVIAAKPRDPALGSIEGSFSWESKAYGHIASAAEIVLLKGIVEIPLDRAVMVVDKHFGVSAAPDEACTSALNGFTMATRNSKLETLGPCGKAAFDSIKNQAGSKLYDIRERVIADDKGHFEIANITPGDYTLIIKSQDTKALTLRDMRGKVLLLHVKIEAGKTFDATHNFGGTEF